MEDMYKELYLNQVDRSCEFARIMGFLKGRIDVALINLKYPTPDWDVSDYLEKTLEEAEKMTEPEKNEKIIS